VPGAARWAQNVGARLGLTPAATGPRSYLEVLNDYNANPARWPTPNVIPPGISKREAGDALGNQLQYNILNPAASPGTGGVTGTNLSRASLAELQDKSGNLKTGGAFLTAVEKNPSIAAEFASDPSLAPGMRMGASANLALNADKNIPRLDRSGTLEHFYGTDAPIVRQEHAPALTTVQREAAETQRHRELMRLLYGESVGILGGPALGAIGHFDPSLTAALTTAGAAIPYGFHLYGRHPQTIGGMAVGGALGGVAGLNQ
jgi:hypothetical protein